jgi:hypothetical protein
MKPPPPVTKMRIERVRSLMKKSNWAQVAPWVYCTIVTSVPCLQREKSPYRPWLLICEGFAACAVKECVLGGFDSGRRREPTEEPVGFSNHHRFGTLFLYIMQG